MVFGQFMTFEGKKLDYVHCFEFIWPIFIHTYILLHMPRNQQFNDYLPTFINTFSLLFCHELSQFSDNFCNYIH